MMKNWILDLSTANNFETKHVSETLFRSLLCNIQSILKKSWVISIFKDMLKYYPYFNTDMKMMCGFWASGSYTSVTSERLSHLNNYEKPE